MSYQALYRKWRPDNFEDVKGQDHIVTTLKNQINADRIGHAYLFCGTRGTGKTSVAKIFAKAVNCEHPVDGNPCGECASCRAIAAGTSMNVIEIDAASNNGVDNIREIREEVAYRPTEGNYKVYIIDEVHMLSTGAFNALLKTLEEPPSYVIFILATTEAHKIPITILSRCQQYDFHRINLDTIAARLQELMEDRLKKRQQIMLFLNRRGISGFISCRACGYVIQCPHCDVSLSQHAGGRMVCHYCGYEQPLPKICPSCGSKYLGGFKAGTQKIEMLVRQRFPQARVMRMDFDTTRTKDAYEKILHAFANQEADILIGTQMIVKGHDFPNVTLVGVLAADMSLHVPDFHASERTFQLLTQAVGRAGRGKEPGQAVIQTYDPDHFAIQTAKEQDYDAFYKQEIAYRRMLAYPPVWQLILIHCTGTDPQVTTAAARDLAEFLHRVISQKGKNIMLVGPADASIAKISDVYRKVIYMKAPEYATLVACKDLVERKIKNNSTFSNVSVQFDFNPTSGF